MVVCSAAKCSNSSRMKEMRFFKFPSEESRRKLWMMKAGLEKDPGAFAKLCGIHFEESQFELHRQDGWKKLKPNAVPTVFPDPPEVPRIKREKSPRKRRRSPSEESDVPPPKRKKSLGRKKGSPNQESSTKKKKQNKKLSKAPVTRRKKDSSPNTQSVSKRKQVSSNNSQNSQKENVSPRLRKSPRPCKAIPFAESDLSTEEEDNFDVVDEVEESEDDEKEQQIALFKRENESMKQEISEFEKHNKAMARVILELEKHNKLMGLKLAEMDKDNKVLNKRISDLERQNEDLKAKLNCSFSEEQLARMDKMKQLGTIERYIPAFK